MRLMAFREHIQLPNSFRDAIWPNLPAIFWTKVVDTAFEIRNPKEITPNKISHHEALFGTKLSMYSPLSSSIHVLRYIQGTLDYGIWEGSKLITC